MLYNGKKSYFKTHFLDIKLKSIKQHKMDYTNLAIGIFALGFGLTTLIMRFTGKTQGIGKLEKMKQTYGEKTGNLIHFSAYTLVPIVVGIVFLIPFIAQLF